MPELSNFIMGSCDVGFDLLWIDLRHAPLNSFYQVVEALAPTGIIREVRRKEHIYRTPH